MTNFTKEQIKELSSIFGIEPKVENIYKVSDGYVSQDDMVWWHGFTGPEYVYVGDDLHNIKNYPQYYSINKPQFKAVYSYDERYHSIVPHENT